MVMVSVAKQIGKAQHKGSTLFGKAQYKSGINIHLFKVESYSRLELLKYRPKYYCFSLPHIANLYFGFIATKLLIIILIQNKHTQLKHMKLYTTDSNIHRHLVRQLLILLIISKYKVPPLEVIL